MRKNVCSFGGSYTREELWYNDITNQFFINQYHYGVIDDEEHFDGTEQINTLAALKKMIKRNKLRAVLMYQNELNLSRDLDIVLADLKKSSTIYDYAFLSVITEITVDADSIEECAVCLLKKENVCDEFIDEFRTQFVENKLSRKC